MRLVNAMACVATLAVALGCAGCGNATSQTRIEHGDTVSTGVSTFDTFFREVTEVKGEAEKTGSELTDATRPLMDAIGAQNKNAPADVVRAEAKKLQMGGTLLHLDLLPETKVVTSAKPDSASETLLNAAEQAAKGSLAVARRATEVLTRIADLERRHSELASSVSESFKDAEAREQVAKELVGAKVLLTDARAAIEKHGGNASRLALDLAMALETGAGSATAMQKKPGKPGAGSRPTGTGSPAKPKGDDFDK